MAEHLQRGEHVRKLVDRGGGEARTRSERAGQERNAEHGRVGVDARVSDIERHGAPAMLALDRRQPLPGLVQRLLPGHRSPAAAFAPLRLADAVGISLHIADRCRLRADVPAAEGIVGIAADALQLGAVQLDREAADGLAEHAGVEARRHAGHAA